MNKRTTDEDEDAIRPAPTVAESSMATLRRKSDTLSLSRTITVDRAVSSIFVLGGTTKRPSQDHSRASEPVDLAAMSREELGGIEYRALRVMLKIAAGKKYAMLYKEGTKGHRIFCWSACPRYPVLGPLDPYFQYKIQGLSGRARPGRNLVVCITVLRRLNVILTDHTGDSTPHRP